MAWTDYYLDLADGGSGDGSTGDPFATYAEAITDIAAADANPVTKPTRIFVRGDLTLAGAVAFSLAGSQANPVHWVGCTGSGTTWTRIGNSGSTAKPTLTMSGATGQATVTGVFQHFEGLGFVSVSTSTGGTLYSSASDINFIRCRVVNSTNNAASRAARFVGAKTVVLACYFQAHTGATYCVSHDATIQMFGCVVNGGAIGISNGGNFGVIANCIVYGHSTSAISAGVGCAVINNTIYGGSATGITYTDDDGFAVNNLIVSPDGTMDYPIDQTTGTDGIQPVCAFNAWYNTTNDFCDGLVEIGADNDDECASFGNTGLLVGDPLPNAGTIGNINDFDLAVAYQRLAFGVFEGGGGYSYTGYASHGALQPLPDFPAVGNVHDDDTVDGAAGTLTLPAVEDVETGVTYGAGGTEFTGTLAGGGGGGIWMPRARQVGV